LGERFRNREDCSIKMKNPKNIKRGKRAKASGADFERRVRKDLEEKGWIVSKWPNNVEFSKEYPLKVGSLKMLEREAEGKKHEGKLIPSKHKFRGAGIPMAIGTGFPDFFAYKDVSEDIEIGWSPSDGSVSFPLYQIQFIESKVDGYLSKEEKAKAQWYLKNNYCSKFLIAYKTKEKNRVKVNYKEVELE